MGDKWLQVYLQERYLESTGYENTKLTQKELKDPPRK